MVNVENLIVKGKYFIPSKVAQINELKNTLQSYLSKKGYEPEDFRSNFFQDKFFTANYGMSLGRLEFPLDIRLKQWLGQLTNEEAQIKLYHTKLWRKRKEIPFNVKICLSLQKVNDVDGIVIDVTSIPVVYYQITQIDRNIYLDKSDYGMIKYENTEFIKELMAAIHAQTLSEPKLLSDYIKNEVSEKLKAHKFTKAAECLDNGRKKLEMGEDTYDDLIGVIEIFLFDLVSRFDTNPASRANPEKNISKLKVLGYLSDKTEGTIRSALFVSVYSKLKDIQHKKEHLDYFDAILYYGITESIIDYLLEKVVKYRIKTEKSANAENAQNSAPPVRAKPAASKRPKAVYKSLSQRCLKGNLYVRSKKHRQKNWHFSIL